MKKTDVYVVVDTPKKAKKLKKTLDMFGENVYSLRFKYCAMGSLCKDEWHSGSTPPDNKTEVSIKELRNILAKEHLKSGDVVIAGIGETRYVVVVITTGIRRFYIGGSNWICVNGDDFPHQPQKGRGWFNNFIRYATEEEKALLEPKKELEIGKWYKGNVDIESLIFITEIENVKYYNRIHGYGFIGGKWDGSGHLFSNTDHEKSLFEATYEEVKQALIEEAKRRGFVNGSIGNNSNIHNKNLKDCELFFNNQYEFDEKDNSLRLILDADTTWPVFKDGKWATIIEQGNFTDSDISIVERLHDVLLDNHGYSLESKLLTDARMLANKIKSNIK